MSGIAFGSAKIVDEYKGEIKKMERVVFMRYKGEIIEFLELVRRDMAEIVHRECMSHRGERVREGLNSRDIERKAADILNRMESDLKQEITQKYMLVERPEEPEKKTRIADRLRDWPYW